MSAKAEEGEKPTEEKPKKSKKKLIIFAVIGLVSLVGGAGVASFFMGSKPPAEEHAEEELHEPKDEVKEIQTADLGQFIVNLSDMGTFLKVRIMIEYDSALLDKQLGIKGGEEGGQAHGGGASGGAKEPAGGGTHPHLTKKENQFRDVIIRILSSKKATELLTVEGKTRLKEELLDGLNEAVGLEEPAVVGILFTDFMIQ
ncbi:MAG: flagellar basal body-associated protein FliL [Pseudomonadota bacterium]|jgi:flagellar FliL protein